MPIRTVAALLPSQTAVFEFGVICEVFGIDRTVHGVPKVDFRVCSEEPEVRLTNEMSLNVPHRLDGLSGADVVVVAATASRDFSPALLQAVRDAHAAGATIVSVCSGAFILAEAGILDGRVCTTHWFHAQEMRDAYPQVQVDDAVLYVDEGDIITSAGTAAGIDALLHLVRREQGAQVATAIARRMVVPPQRDGGQRQYVDLPIPACTADSLEPVLAWMTENLTAEQSVKDLARRASMSERTFARRFVAETGTTPAKWLTLQRVHRARELLEGSDLSVERVAGHAGFGSAALLRHHFTKQVGVAPADYRRTFACEVREVG